MKILNNKAAMFGLDARIALAIFGALSVISGAALYSAIQTAKATALLVDMKDAGKAWEQFYLDTGQNLEQIESSNSSDEGFYLLKTMQLVENPGITGWKGPYLNYTGVSNQRSDVVGSPSHPSGVWLTISNNGTWGGSFNFRTNTTLSSGRCLAGANCSIWVMFIFIDKLSLILKVDEIVDSGDGADKGDFRWNTFSDLGGENRVFLKISPIANPND